MQNNPDNINKQNNIKKILLNKIKEKKSEKSEKNFGAKFLIGFFIFIFISIISGILFLFYLLQGLPTMKELKDVQTKESTQILDRNGNVLYTIFGDENREVVPFDKISNMTIYGIISLEDENFFEHGGVDYKGLTRAILGQLGLINFEGGGSTITQQFVKNKYLSSERTYIRKLKEMILSMQLENTYTKEEIITMYLNQIPFGSNIYGIEQASKRFFGKNSNELDLAESVIIASIPNATTRYSPYGNHIRSKYIGNTKKISIGLLPNKIEKITKKIVKTTDGSGNTVEKLVTSTGTEFLGGRTTLALEKMLELGYINEEQKKQAIEELLNYKFKKNIEKIRAPHFVMLVKEKLEKEFGDDILKQGGLKIFTSLDLKMQEKAEELVAKNAKYNKEKYDAENQSLLTMDTKNGEILAMVGSRNYFDKEIDGQVNIMTSKRLAGSTFKPFAYTAMLLNGYSPYSIVFDTETNFGEEGHDYEPQNFDGKFMGPLSLGKALGNSRNIPAIKAGLVGGIEKTYNIAKSMGIKFDNAYDWYGASLPLGTVGVRGIDLLSAYMVFANNGEKIEPKYILKIIDKNGTILKKEEKKSEKKIVLNPQIAYQVTTMLSDPKNRGIGWNSRMQLKGRVNTAKTGTSNKSVVKKGYKKPIVMPLDGWTVGSTPQYSTIVWSGNNDGRTMNLRGSGRGTSAKTWKEFMEYLHKGKEVEQFKKPEGIKLVKIAKLSGLLPSKNTPKELIQTGVFSDLNIPKTYDNSLKFINIDKVSKKIPTEFTPEDAIINAAVLNLHSLRPYDKRWEDPVKDWLKENGKEFLKKYGIKDILANVPNDVDNVHTRENTLFGPEFSISFPKDGGIVGSDGFSVIPEINSKNGVARVDYYLNGKLSDSSFNFPYIGNIKLDKNLAINSKISLKIKVFDELYNSSQKTISLKVGEDNKKPYTEIVRPKEGQKLVAGSTFDVKTLTYDEGGQINKVVFYLDGKEIGKISKPPFSQKIKIPRLVGKHKIKVIAVDTSGNSQFDEKEFNVIRLKNSSKEINLNLPKNFVNNKPFDFSVSMPYSEIKNFEKIEVIAKKRTLSGGEEEFLVSKIDDFSGNATGFFYLNGILKKGNYVVFLKKYKKFNENGKKFSKKEIEEGKNVEIGKGFAIEVK